MTPRRRARPCLAQRHRVLRARRRTESQRGTALVQLADGQAALRRVAELVARGVEPQEVLDAVAGEAAALLDGQAMTLVRFDGDHELVVVAAQEGPAPLGARILIEADTLPHRVRRTGTVDRVDDYTRERDAVLAAKYGMTAAVAAPISVAGRVWGLLAATSAGGPLPAGTEERLDQFAQLVSAALANSEARTDLHALVDEQAALRRVAELAAREAPEAEVLKAVASEASRLAGVDFTTLLRYEPDGATEIVAIDGAPDGIVVGMRAPGTGDGAVQRVWRTGQPARINNLAEMSGEWPKLAHRHGFTASAAVPIVIRGALWGALVAVRRGAFARPIEEHLANFAELAATAVSAADARQELRVLADEQAALRRVAELVARGATLDEVFSAAATEASTLLGSPAAVLLRYDDGDGHGDAKGAGAVAGVSAGAGDRDDTGVVAVAVAVCNSPMALDQRVPVDADNALGVVRSTGRPTRVESFAGTSLADIAANLGVAAGVAVPVTVEGRVWGALTASTAGPPLPTGSEERLTPFAELVAAAIANAENRAKLTASRARVVATADETRRRLQRDVHDGAQQRLVHTIIALKLARDAVRAGEPPTDLLDEALSNAERANRELRDVVRGILPASLTRGGLRAGLESLVADLALPVDLRVSAARLPPHVETTAYFIVAEATTNVVKHARARRVTIDAGVDGQALVIEVHDDGVGGADPAAGTGLTGLFDRVEASNGTLAVVSGPGTGTTIRATLPLDPQSTAPSLTR